MALCGRRTIQAANAAYVRTGLPEYAMHAKEVLKAVRFLQLDVFVNCAALQLQGLRNSHNTKTPGAG